jgi:hypothetical protein
MKVEVESLFIGGAIAKAIFKNGSLNTISRWAIYPVVHTWGR